MLPSEIDKHIKVIDHWLTKDGLTVQYELDGKDLTLIANPEQTCEILKKHGFINEYTGAGEDVAVEFDYDFQGTERTAQMHWEAYWPYVTVSQLDALQMVIEIEKDKAYRRLAKGVGK